MIFYLLSRKKKRTWEAIETMLWRTGGMPSSHSAVVCALATATGIYEGVSSTYFVIALILALVVLRDSVGVRRASGLQAKALNNLGRQIAKITEQEFHSVKEIQGHTPLEVLVGSCLGIVIAVVIFLL
ncbi:MAG: divergent PAP2 family protein [Treponema sp.]|nr:divergent PAP2 family protein [Treponema sp.]MCL2251555.1 divergent PAP2 family protein [Treponema sp.]